MGFIKSLLSIFGLANADKNEGNYNKNEKSDISSETSKSSYPEEEKNAVEETISDAEKLDFSDDSNSSVSQKTSDPIDDLSSLDTSNLVSTSRWTGLSSSFVDDDKSSDPASEKEPIKETTIDEANSGMHENVGSEDMESEEIEEPTETISINNFFGIDLKKSPNDDWNYLGLGIKEGKQFYQLENITSDKYFFDRYVAYVDESFQTEFYLTKAYSEADIQKVVFLIEKEFGNGEISSIVKSNTKYSEEISGIGGDITWSAKGCKIVFSYTIGDDIFSVRINPNFFNKEYFANDRIYDDKIVTTHGFFVLRKMEKYRATANIDERNACFLAGKQWIDHDEQLLLMTAIPGNNEIVALNIETQEIYFRFKSPALEKKIGKGYAAIYVTNCQLGNNKNYELDIYAIVFNKEVDSEQEEQEDKSEQEITKSSEPKNNGEDHYSIAKVKVVGFEDLDEDDKEFVRDDLEEGTSVYLRYDFEASDKKCLLQVWKFKRVIGYIDPHKVDTVLSYLQNIKIGGIYVSKKKSKDFKTSFDLQIYYRDSNGKERLPYTPLEGRPLSVVETDLWTGQEDWSEDWFLNIYTDELCYKYLNLYDNTVDEHDKSEVDWQLLNWINSYNAGTCITKKGGEQYCLRLKSECAKQVLVKRMESYLESKDLHFAEKEAFNDNNETEITALFAEKDVVKQYKPTFEISYKDAEGKYVKKTIMNANLGSFIAGVKHRENYEEKLAKLTEGMSLQLKPEKDNPFDPNAIAVYNGDDMLGYIPKKDVPAVTLIMRSGSLIAEIEYIEDDRVDLIIPASFDCLLDMSDDKLEGFSFTRTDRTKYINGSSQKKSIISKEELVEGIRRQKENL